MTDEERKIWAGLCVIVTGLTVAVAALRCARAQREMWRHFDNCEECES